MADETKEYEPDELAPGTKAGPPLTKQCSKCKQTKEASCFHKDSSNKDGLDPRCKPCVSERDKKRREKRKKNRLEETLPEGYKRCANACCNKVFPLSHFQSTVNRRTKLTDKCEKCRARNKKNDKKYQAAKKENIREQKKEYRAANKEKIREQQKEYNAAPVNKERRNEKRRNRYKNDDKYKLTQLLRSRVRIALKSQNTKKNTHTLQLTSCTMDFLRDYISQKFEKGMTWDNHGDWHIDHRKPCRSFDLTKIEEQRKCFHYTNLQPLWKSDNIQKRDKFNEATFEYTWVENKGWEKNGVAQNVL